MGAGMVPRGGLAHHTACQLQTDGLYEYPKESNRQSKPRRVQKELKKKQLDHVSACQGPKGNRNDSSRREDC